MRLRSLISAVALSTLMIGCANFKPVEPGMTAQQVYVLRGNPNAVYPDGKGGHILEWYAHEYTQFAYMAEMDENDIVVWYGNVRTDERFARIKVNKSTKKDVILTVGHPSETEYLSRRQQEVWSYRYQESGVWNSMMHIYFDGNGVVRHMEKGMDDLELYDDRGGLFRMGRRR